LRAPAVLVPFKGGGYKSRLSPILGPQERREVAYLLLNGVLRAVRNAGMEGRCHVVSSDPGARILARKAGSSFVQESRAAGVNAAVRFAMKRLGDAERVMVIPSDLPMLSPAELLRAEELGRAKSLVIAPSSSFGGTNLLLFSRHRAPALSYDNNSFWNHLAGAARLGLPTAVFTSRGVLFDLDTPADVANLLSLGINTRVARFLRKSLAK